MNQQLNQNKSILITGGLGFLGSYAIEKYKKNNNKINFHEKDKMNVVGPEIKPIK